MTAVGGPVAHSTRATSAAAAVRRAILDGRLPPGSRINEVHIAAELGFSRGPLREGLRALEEEGLVVKRPYRGAFVAEVGSDEIEEIASLRVRLEPFAIELALPRLRAAGGKAAINELLEELIAAAAANDVPGCIDVHLRMHRMVYELSHHKLLLDNWTGWESQLRIYFALDASTFTSLTGLVEDHRRLIELMLNAGLDEITDEVAHHVQGAAEHAAATVRETRADHR
jgi:DNA-binding GntR family transcriptional regulator